MQGLVDYGSGSDSDTEQQSTSAAAPAPKAVASSSFLNLPPPKSAMTLPTPSSSSSSATAATVAAPAAKSAPLKSGKKGKGPLRMVLDLPMPGQAAASKDEEDDEPAKKKLKLGSGGGQLSGLAAMLPKPKHESVAVKLEKALGSAGSSAPATATVGDDGEVAEKPQTAAPAFMPYSLSKGKAKAKTSAVAAPAEPEVDFFGLGSVSSAPVVPSASRTKPSVSSKPTISSAPSLAPPPPPPSAKPKEPTADDPYPGFTQLPSGEWVATSQEAYDNWVASVAAQPGSSAPKDFAEKIIAAHGGMQDLDELQRAREAWANRPEQLGADGRPGQLSAKEAEEAKAAALAKLGKAGKLGQGAGRAKAKGQLSALLADAVSNRAELEERIAQGRANRRNAGNKYGF